MFDVGAHHRRGRFRTQRERAPSRSSNVYISLLTTSVSSPTPRDEQRGLLENRRADLLVVVDAKHLARRGLDVIPDGARRRQNVARSFDCFDHVDRRLFFLVDRAAFST